MTKFFLFASLLFLPAILTGQDIDLNNWKLTLPIGIPKPMEVEPPEILNYSSIKALKPFFYKDTTDGSIVFYAYPAASTRNSSYSRTELREQMVPGSNATNWTFAQGGTMRGTLSVPKVTQDAVGKYHRTIVMQIHGRLTNAQRDLIGADDNNASPILKIYWVEGKIRVKTKVLKDLNATDIEILHEEAWGDDEGRTFREVVGTGKFTLEIKVSDGRMEVSLNDKETFVYDDIHMKRWGVFENYFKAGNYFQSKKGGHAYVKYYALEMSHTKEIKAQEKEYEQSIPSSTSTKKAVGIDLSYWKLELPTGYTASEWKLSNFQQDRFVKPFFYLDSLDGALAMEAYPSTGTSKAKYTKTSLREQMVPGESSTNWTVSEGGVLVAEFQVVEMSKETPKKYHRTVLFSIQGRTTSDQMKELGLDKSVNVPLLTILWEGERIRVKRKILKDVAAKGNELLSKSAWENDGGRFFNKKIGFEKAKIELKITEGRIEVQLNEQKPIVYRDASIKKWPFENYFNAGNYLQTKKPGSKSKVKFYQLQVTH